MELAIVGGSLILPVITEGLGLSEFVVPTFIEGFEGAAAYLPEATILGASGYAALKTASKSYLPTPKRLKFDDEGSPQLNVSTARQPALYPQIEWQRAVIKGPLSVGPSRSVRITGKRRSKSRSRGYVVFSNRSRS